MGQYKVPQNVEAEDKILGPLTLKQFMYTLIAIGWAGLCFMLFSNIPIVMFTVAAPVTLLFLMLGLYQRDGQNFEQLLVALVSYFSQSRQRIWLKEPIVQSFTVTPQKVEIEQSQRNPVEVRSELDKLASIVDARGWAQPHDTAGVLPVDQPTSAAEQRIIMPSAAPAQAANVFDSAPENDIMDLQHSPLAKNLNELLNEAAAEVREEAVEAMKAKTTQPSVSVTAAPPGDILKLATENDDLTVSQIAANATRVAPLAEGQSVTLRNGSTNTTQAK